MWISMSMIFLATQEVANARDPHRERIIPDGTTLALWTQAPNTAPATQDRATRYVGYNV